MFVVVYRGLINELLAKELLIGVLKQQNAGFWKSAAEENWENKLSKMWMSIVEYFRKDHRCWLQVFLMQKLLKIS